MNMNILLFLLLSFLGGIIGILLKMPAGALLGPMILIGTFQMIICRRAVGCDDAFV
jgi:uncharacterized membrane protein AbrB (regulator of aidB expression)